MNAFENINNLTMEDAAKERICENLATRLEKQEKGVSRTWGVAFTSKRVRAVAAIALSAAIVTAVAVPVGIYYGVGSVEVSSGFSISSVEAFPLFYTAYQFDRQSYLLNDSISVSFSYGIAAKSFFESQFDLDERSEHDKVNGNFYALIYNEALIEQECKKYPPLENEYNGDIYYISPTSLFYREGLLIGMKAGELNAKNGFYVHDVIEFQDKNTFPFDKYAIELEAEYFNLQRVLVHYHYSEVIVVPPELFVGTEGVLHFCFGGYIEFENMRMIGSAEGKYMRAISESCAVYYKVIGGKIHLSTVA